MEPSKKPPFKLQSLLKLNNRITEKELRNIATVLATNLDVVFQKTKDMESILSKDKAMANLLDTLDFATSTLVEVLQLVILTGSNQYDIVQKQKGLTYKADQAELEKLFKLITSTLEARTEARVKRLQSKCGCQRCCAARKAKATNTNTKQQPVRPKKQPSVTSVKVHEFKITDVTSIEDALQQIKQQITQQIKNGEPR